MIKERELYRAKDAWIPILALSFTRNISTISYVPKSPEEVRLAQSCIEEST